jgi:hypothetical protein
MFAETVSYPAAYLAGLLSFFSPCILPLIPAYFSFITGFSLEELTEDPSAQIRRKVIGSTLAYISGFTAVFILMGASASFLGSMITEHRGGIRIIGGILILVLGVHLTGILRFRKLDVEKRIHLKKRPLHFLGTFLVGMAFDFSGRHGICCRVEPLYRPAPGLDSHYCRKPGNGPSGRLVAGDLLCWLGDAVHWYRRQHQLSFEISDTGHAQT